MKVRAREENGVHAVAAHIGKGIAIGSGRTGIDSEIGSTAPIAAPQVAEPNVVVR